MRLFILLTITLLAQTSYGYMCSDLHKRLNVGGTIIARDAVKSQKIKEAFQRILNSPEAGKLLPMCDGSALGVNTDSTFGGVFLIKEDIISGWLLRSYALDGDAIFEDVNTRVLPWTSDQFGPFTTLNLPAGHVPTRVPGLVSTSTLFDTYSKVVAEDYAEQVSVLVDKDTREALLFKFRVNE